MRKSSLEKIGGSGTDKIMRQSTFGMKGTLRKGTAMHNKRNGTAMRGQVTVMEGRETR